MKNLDALLNARSVAVVGASDKPGSFGGHVMRNLVEFGFPGDLFGVHPKLSEVYGRPCYPSLGEAPHVPDCLALAVANDHLLGMLEQAGEQGVKAAVVFGDPTVGAGRDPGLQDQIAGLADRHGMAICGPNAMGVYALHERLVISGYPVDAGLSAGSTALITASGTVFDALSQNNRHVAFSHVISCGNEAVLGAAEYLYHVLQQPQTKAVAIYLETVRNPHGFVEALELARHKDIPVIALKVGLSEQGRAMAQAHTGALAGNAETYEALFDHYGVVHVRTLDEMMDTIELFSRVQHTDGNRIAALMESGGERSLVVDLAQDLNIAFSNFSEQTHSKLEDILEEGVTPANPLDAFGSGHDIERVYSQCLEVMSTDPDTDLVLLAVDLVRDSYLSPMYVNAALTAQPNIDKPLVAMVNLTAGANIELMATLRANNIPVLMGTHSALRALSHLHDFRARTDPDNALRAHAETSSHPSALETLAQHQAPLTEHDSKLLLCAFGVPVTDETVVANETEAVAAAEAIGYPVVIKTAEATVLHKSDVGGIHLRLEDQDAVLDAYRQLADQIGPQALVQEMIDGGTELLLGMKSDPQFGPIILIGLGGIFVEVYKDVVATLPTTDPDRILALLQRLQGYPLLTGTRGRANADLYALVDTIAKFSTFVTACADHLQEVDVNPLLVSPDGVCALDALIVPRKH